MASADPHDPFAPPPDLQREKALRRKLSLMMFLQFFIWGAWFELGFDYIPKLGFNGDWQLPLIFGAFNVGALVALFFSTQFASAFSNTLSISAGRPAPRPLAGGTVAVMCCTSTTSGAGWLNGGVPVSAW